MSWLDTLEEYLESIFSGSGLIDFVSGTWNMFLRAAYSLLSADLESMGSANGETLLSVSHSIFELFMIVAASLAAVFCLVTFLKGATDLRHGMTMEYMIQSVIRVIITEGIILNSWLIIQRILRAEQYIVMIVAPGGVDPLLVTIDSDDWSVGALSFISSFFFALLLFFVSVGCGILLMYTVYGIYLKIFFYICMAPLAISSLAGPEGAQQSAFSWLKNFLCAIGEPGAILLVLRLMGQVASAGGFFDPGDGTGIEDSVLQMLQVTLTIVLTTGAVRGVDTWLRRALGF